MIGGLRVGGSLPTRLGAFGRAALTGLIASAGCTDGVTAPVPGPPRGTLEIVVDGLSAPVFLTAPDGDTDRLFVVERGGRIRIVRNGSVEPTPFLDVSSLVRAGGEQGLLGMAFHPSYPTNGFFFVNYTDTGGDTRVVRYRVSSDPDRADPSTDQLVLAVPQPFANHNGGHLAFGPDGLLYIGLGDGGSGGDPQEHGQNPATLLGSMLRIDVDGGSPYAIPPDNPFVGSASAAPETWAFGLRNPWRYSFDRDAGDLFIADVGQNALEEISYQPAASSGGENYGWDTMEGTRCFEPSSGCDPTGLELPVFEYDHSEGCSVTGGYVYRGSANPTLVGRYFFADFCSTWVRSFRVVSGSATELTDHSDDFGAVSQVSSFGEDGVGELYIVSLQGTVYRIVEP